MIDTMVGLLEVCTKANCYIMPKNISSLENYLRYTWKIRYEDE